MAVSRSTKEAWQRLGPNLANIFQDIGAKRQRRAEFAATMAMQELQRRDEQAARDKSTEIQGRYLEMAEERADRELKTYETDLEERAELDDLRRQAEEVRTIISGEIALPGVSSYEKGQSWAEHPGIQEAGLGPTVLQMHEELKAFAPEKPDYMQMKAAFEMNIMYGVDLPTNFQVMPDVVAALEKGKLAYAKAQTDADRIAVINIATAEANLKVAEWDAEHPGGRAPAGPAPGLVQNRAMVNFESIVVNGGRPTDEQFMAAFGYLPDDEGKKAIVTQILENYEAAQSGLIMPGGGG